MQHSPTTAMLSTSFLLRHASQKPQAKCIDYKIQGVIQQREYESWVEKTEEIKQRLVEFRQRTNTASEKCNFCAFLFPDNAETEVIWAGIVKRLLIPYFIGRICAKNIKNPFTYVKVITIQRWDVFWDTV